MTEKTGRETEEERKGGYGDDAGAVEPAAAEKQGSSATGRENPVTDSADADEALGNRTGGYGDAETKK